MKLIFAFSLLLLNLLGDNHKADTPGPVKLQGVVMGKDNRPVSNAYLFIIKGEEETITGSNGQFALTTWQKFPVSLSVEHPDYKRLKLLIKEADQKQIIKLERP
jgi:hypothetical protein